MSTLDNNNANRFSKENGGFTATDGDTFNLVYKFVYGSKFDAQEATKCMYNEPD